MVIPIEVRFVTLHQIFVRGPLFLFFKLVSYFLSISGLFTEQFLDTVWERSQKHSSSSFRNISPPSRSISTIRMFQLLVALCRRQKGTKSMPRISPTMCTSAAEISASFWIQEKFWIVLVMNPVGKLTTSYAKETSQADDGSVASSQDASWLG